MGWVAADRTADRYHFFNDARPLLGCGKARQSVAMPPGLVCQRWWVHMRKTQNGMARAMSKMAGYAAGLAAAGLMMVAVAPARADESPGKSAPVALDDADAVAALDGISIALTEVGDGGSYVWRRTDGRLSGMAQPTTSFRDATGQPCRHLIVVLNATDHSAKFEGTACRTAAGQWHLAG